MDCDISTEQRKALVPHRNAPLTETGRLRLARCVVDDCWSLRRAAERFQVSPTTAQRWADRYRQLGEAAADLNIRSQPAVDAQTRLTAQLCALAPDTAARLRCAEGAARYFVFHFDRVDEAEAFCRLLGSLRRRCTKAAESGA